MKILEFHTRIMKIINNYRNPPEIHETRENQKKSSDNYENYENCRTQCENH